MMKNIKLIEMKMDDSPLAGICLFFFFSSECFHLVFLFIHALIFAEKEQCFPLLCFFFLISYRCHAINKITILFSTDPHQF